MKTWILSMMMCLMAIPAMGQLAKDRRSDSVPYIQIFDPTDVSSLSTTTGSKTIGGSAWDLTAVTSVTWSCDNSASPASGTATGTEDWEFSTTISSGVTTCTVTVNEADAAALTDQIQFTAGGSDTTAPNINVTSPADQLTTANAVTSIIGTASDNVGVSSVTSSVISGTGCTAGSVTGTTSWSFNASFTQSGTCTFRATASDAALNTSFANRTITWTGGSLSITSPTVLAQCAVNSSCSRTLTVSGGVPSYTWAESTSTLGSGACTGLSLSSGGVLSGTPTTTGTCSFTSQVTDSATPTPNQATKAHTIDIVSALSGNDYFEAHKAGPYYHKDADFRSTDNINSNSSASPNNWFTYDSTFDAARFDLGPEDNGFNTDLVPRIDTTVPTSGQTWLITYDIRYDDNWKEAINEADTLCNGWAGSKFVNLDANDTDVGGGFKFLNHHHDWPQSLVDLPTSEFGVTFFEMGNGPVMSPAATTNITQYKAIQPNNVTAFNLKEETWIRTWWWIVEGTPDANETTFSVWMADESTDPVKLIDDLLFIMPWDGSVGFKFARFQSAPKVNRAPKPPKTNACTPFVPWNGFEVSGWYRNFLVLKNVPVGSINDYLVKPVP